MTDVTPYYKALAELNRKDREMNEMLYLQGMQDCKDGKPHEAGKGESYDRGYSCQYTHEANMEAMSRG